MDNQGDENCFEFAFDNPLFSDRVLQIEVTDETLVFKQINSSTTKKLKKRKINKKKIQEADENKVEVRVKHVHVNSAVLAAKSAFFYKLFSNGMRDSNNKCETNLKIKTSEEAPLKELLHFMYTRKFSSMDTSDYHSLLAILILADKYEVIQCMKYCIQLLLRLPMTQESALLYLELPPSVSMNMEVQPLMDASKKHLVARYIDIEKSQSELMNLSIVGLEMILSSDHILPRTEDDVSEVIIDWARHHYPNVEERREVLSSLITRFVRFPYLSCKQLRKFLDFEDINRATLLESITDALLFKDEHLREKHALASMDSTNKQFIERSYKWRPIKVVESETPMPHSVVYFNLKAFCKENNSSLSHSFGIWLYLVKSEKISASCRWAVRKNPDKFFIDVVNGSHTFGFRGSYNLFNTSWSTFIAESSPYFINDMLHLQVEIIINT